MGNNCKAKPEHTITRHDLINLYYTWRNDFLTVDYFAEYYGLHTDHAKRLIDVVRDIARTPHPEA